MEFLFLAIKKKKVLQDGIIQSCKSDENKYDKDYNMGSRGQALKSGGFTEYKYHTIARYNNVRFVVQNEGKRVKLPEMSNSRWAVYATLGTDGKLKSISFYNGSRKKYKEFDMDDHKGLGSHIHTCNPKTSLRIDYKVPPRKPTSHEMARIQKIIDFYNRHNLKEFGKRK